MKVKVTTDEFVIVSFDAGGDPYYDEIDITKEEYDAFKFFIEKFWMTQKILKEKLDARQH